MSDEPAFLRAIIEDGDNDTPRLVFADWLEEHDQPERAELIRTQCRLGRMDITDGSIDLIEWIRLDQRASDLLAHHETDWRAKLPTCGGGWRWGSFDRGFINSITIDDWTTFQSAAAAILDAQPVQRLILERVTATALGGIAELPAASRVRELVISHSAVAAEPPQEFWQSPQLRGLRSLTINFAQAAGWVAPLVDRRAFPQLTSLRFCSANLSDETLRPIFRANHWEQLRDLDLNGNQLTLNALAAALCGPLLPGLTTLDLSSNSLRGESLTASVSTVGPLSMRSLTLRNNPLGLPGIRLLASPDLFPQLQLLDLSAAQLEREAIRRLTQAPFWPNLLDLLLDRNPLGDAGVRPLVEGTPPTDLRMVDLSDTGIGPEGIRLLAQWPGLLPVRGLALSRTPLGDQGLMTLAQSPYTQGLLILDLSQCQLNGHRIQDFFQSPLMGQLRALNLGDNPLADDTAQLLAASPQCHRLVALQLDRTRIGNLGVRALLESPYLSELRHLALPTGGLDASLIAEVQARFREEESLPR